MTVSELIEKLEEFENREATILVPGSPDDSFKGIMPVTPNAVKLWNVNEEEYVLIFVDPSQGRF